MARLDSPTSWDFTSGQLPYRDQLYKMAVLLVDLHGLSYQETADLLAVPVGTVMSRLYRGRKKLERSLLSFGHRYNYLDAAPKRLRDQDIDTAAIFG
jgi:hypothetical protein